MRTEGREGLRTQEGTERGRRVEVKATRRRKAGTKGNEGWRIEIKGTRRTRGI